MADRVSSKLSSGIVGRKEFCRVKGEKNLSSCSTASAWGKLYYLLSMFFCLFFVWNTKNWRLGLYDGWGKTFNLRSFHSEQEQSPLKGSATHQNQCSEIRRSGATGFRVEPFLSRSESLGQQGMGTLSSENSWRDSWSNVVPACLIRRMFQNWWEIIYTEPKYREHHE